MRIDEFYNPEADNFTSRDEEDVRTPKLTLLSLNKLRRVKELKKAEDLEHDKFVKTMYGNSASDESPEF